MNKSIIEKFLEEIRSSKRSHIQDHKYYRGLIAYKNNYLFSHIKSLQNNNPEVFEDLGENNFRYVAKLYIEKNPSRNPNFNDYGADFLSFISSLSLD